MVQQGYWKGFVTALALCVAFVGGSVVAGGTPGKVEVQSSSDYEVVQAQKRIATALENINRDGVKIKGTVTIEPEYSAFPVEIKK